MQPISLRIRHDNLSSVSPRVERFPYLSRETSVPSKMAREQLEVLIPGLCDHRLAAIEERVAELERKTHALHPLGAATTETPVA
jgi:hypothetical protein